MQTRRSLLAALASLLLFACRTSPPDSDDDSWPPLVVRAHPPGTLLRDAHGTFWMTETWPERSLVFPRMMTEAGLQTGDALPMTWLEAACVRRSGRVWQPSLIRQPNRADRLRDAEALPFRDGTLVVHTGQYFVFFGGLLHPVSDPRLAERVGYVLSSATNIEQTLFDQLNVASDVLDAVYFESCPLDVLQTRTETDRDGDGSLVGRDCDDADANRAPNQIELCDGLDNDCDGATDEGYRLGLACTLDDGCLSPGVTACTRDGYGVGCQNTETLCEN